MSRSSQGNRPALVPVSALMEAARAAERAGNWDDALAHYEQALLRQAPESTASVCELFRKIGQVHFHRGNFDVAEELFETSECLADRADLQEHLAHALNCRANA